MTDQNTNPTAAKKSEISDWWLKARDEAETALNMITKTREQGAAHYVSMKIQPWDILEANYNTDYIRGSVVGKIFKYVMRYQEKNGVEDLRKAKHCLEKLIEIEMKNESN